MENVYNLLLGKKWFACCKTNQDVDLENSMLGQPTTFYIKCLEYEGF